MTPAEKKLAADTYSDDFDYRPDEFDLIDQEPDRNKRGELAARLASLKKQMESISNKVSTSTTGDSTPPAPQRKPSNRVARKLAKADTLIHELGITLRRADPDSRVRRVYARLRDNLRNIRESRFDSDTDEVIRDINAITTRANRLQQEVDYIADDDPLRALETKVASIEESVDYTHGAFGARLNGVESQIAALAGHIESALSAPVDRSELETLREEIGAIRQTLSSLPDKGYKNVLSRIGTLSRKLEHIDSRDNIKKIDGDILRLDRQISGLIDRFGDIQSIQAKLVEMQNLVENLPSGRAPQQSEPHTPAPRRAGGTTLSDLLAGSEHMAAANRSDRTQQRQSPFSFHRRNEMPPPPDSAPDLRSPIEVNSGASATPDDDGSHPPREVEPQIADINRPVQAHTPPPGERSQEPFSANARTDPIFHISEEKPDRFAFLTRGVIGVAACVAALLFGGALAYYFYTSSSASEQFANAVSTTVVKTSSITPQLATQDTLEQATSNDPVVVEAARSDTSGVTRDDIVSRADHSTLRVQAEIEPKSLRSAAENGDPAAQFIVATRYLEGQGVKKNLSMAAKWYESAANKGFAPAQYRLGSMYEKGRGVAKDFDMARIWYQRAIGRGNVKAMHNLGVLHAEGAFGEQDLASASQLFLQAAEYGLRDSQYNLGILNARGLGVPKNLPKAYQWFSIVARNGDKDAQAKRAQIADQLDPEMRAATDLLVNTWKPEPIDVAANSVSMNPAWDLSAATTGSIRVVGENTATDASREMIMEVQALLINKGYRLGQPDGYMGPKTSAAIRSFQQTLGLPADGRVTPALLSALRG